MTNAIALSNKHGLRLRKIPALTLYGNLLKARDRKHSHDVELAEGVLNAAKSLSERTGYMLYSPTP